MFGKKVSSAEYEEMSQRYLTYEAAYMNEKSRTDELKNEVLQLKQKLSEISQNGIVAPGVIEKCNALAEENQKLKQNSSTDGEVLNSLKAQLEEALKTAKDADDFSNRLLQALDAERAKTSELTRRLQNMPKGEKTMSEDFTQWEYKTAGSNQLEEGSYGGFNDWKMDRQAVMNKNLNILGSEGWEVTGTFSGPAGGGCFIMKRPKRQKQEPDYGYSR